MLSLQSRSEGNLRNVRTRASGGRPGARRRKPRRAGLSTKPWGRLWRFIQLAVLLGLLGYAAHQSYYIFFEASYFKLAGIEVLNGRMVSSEEVIRRGADLLARQSGISRDLILGALLERNRLGETPAEAGVALPHLLLNDVEGFHMVAVRSIRGLDFPMAKQTIHAVFLLLGNRGNPTQHLRFLAEIARRAENPHFIDDWIAADSIDDLPGLLLSTEE